MNIRFVENDFPVMKRTKTARIALYSTGEVRWAIKSYLSSLEKNKR